MILLNLLVFDGLQEQIVNRTNFTSFGVLDDITKQRFVDASKKNIFPTKTRRKYLRLSTFEIDEIKWMR